MGGRVTPTILAMDAFETCFAGEGGSLPLSHPAATFPAHPSGGQAVGPWRGRRPILHPSLHLKAVRSPARSFSCRRAPTYASNLYRQGYGLTHLLRER